MQFQARDSKTDSLKDITIKSGFKSVVQDVINSSGDLAETCIESAKYPLIDEVSDPRMRVCVGLGLGCDVLPGGVPDKGQCS